MTNNSKTDLKRILTEKGISQTLLANDLNVSYSYMNRIVNGWEKPSPDLYEQLCDYLDVAELVCEKSNPKIKPKNKEE